jgi:transcriptional antiterminator NusG
MVELNLPDLGWKDTCSKLRRIQGVTGFVGTGSNERPRPIPVEEAKNLLRKSGDIKGDKPVRVSQTYAVGEKVKIIGGSFNSFVGLIEEVNQEKNKLRVVINFFDRAIPVELDLLQVEKI